MTAKPLPCLGLIFEDCIHDALADVQTSIKRGGSCPILPSCSKTLGLLPSILVDIPTAPVCCPPRSYLLYVYFGVLVHVHPPPLGTQR